MNNPQFSSTKFFSPTTTKLQHNTFNFLQSFLYFSCYLSKSSYFSAMNNNQNDEEISSFKNSVSRLKLLDFSLRLSVIPLSVASLCLTVTNNEDNPDYGSIKFINFSGLKYMGCVAAIAAVYAVVAAMSTWIRCLVNKTWVFFVSDQVMAYLMVTSGAAGAELMYLAYKGDIEVSWSEACTAYGNFCTKLKLALILHFLALFCFLVLAIISAFRAFSMFDPPNPINTQVEEIERT